MKSAILVIWGLLMREFSLSETSDRWFLNSDGVMLHNSFRVVGKVISIGIDVLRLSNSSYRS